MYDIESANKTLFTAVDVVYLYQNVMPNYIIEGTY